MKMTFSGLEIRFREDMFGDSYDVLVMDRFNHIFMDRNGTWHEIKEGSAVSDKFKFIKIPKSALQSLANELAEIGVYQDKIKPYENELTATKLHLEDMRTLALNPKSDIKKGEK